MQELKPNPKLLEIAEEIGQEVWKTVQQLNRGPVKMDHNDVRSAIETAMLIQELRLLRHEISYLTQVEKAKAFPNSMFFQQRSLDQNKGE